jgi:HTH-type transcriptional regulator/antitoxin HigA
MAECPPHVGLEIRRQLEEIGMTQVDFARRMGLSTKHVNLLLSGKARVTVPVALGMEKVLGVRADFYIGMRDEWELWQLRNMSGEGKR